MRGRIRNQRFQAEAVWGTSGFTITSVLDLKNHKEWLYTESSVYKERDGKRGYDEQYGGGMEFLFPSDEEEFFQGISYKDHGILWRTPCRMEQTEERFLVEGFHGDTGIRTVWTLGLTEQFILLTLQIHNESAKAFPFLIRLHPSFLFEPDTRLELWEERIVYELSGAYCSFYPESAEARRMEIGNPQTWKEHELFMHIKQRKGGFSIIQNNRSLHVEYENEKLPWLTLCSFVKKGKRIGILEPANVPGISLKSAGRSGALPVLGAKETLEYTFRLVPA